MKQKYHQETARKNLEKIFSRYHAFKWRRICSDRVVPFFDSQKVKVLRVLTRPWAEDHLNRSEAIARPMQREIAMRILKAPKRGHGIGSALTKLGEQERCRGGGLQISRRLELL